MNVALGVGGTGGNISIDSPHNSEASETSVTILDDIDSNSPEEQRPYKSGR